MPTIVSFLLTVWLTLGIFFGYFYGQETRRMLIAGVIVLIVTLLWFAGLLPGLPSPGRV